MTIYLKSWFLTNVICVPEIHPSFIQKANHISFNVDHLWICKFLSFFNANSKDLWTLRSYFRLSSSYSKGLTQNWGSWIKVNSYTNYKSNVLVFQLNFKKLSSWNSDIFLIWGNLNWSVLTVQNPLWKKCLPACLFFPSSS